jgi:hypothetical protein
MTRRRDALFAERVLGCRVNTTASKEPICLCEFRQHSDPERQAAPYNAVRNFTCSLDAAMPGLKKLEKECPHDVHFIRLSTGWLCRLIPDSGEPVEAEAATIEESFVIALLRAAGCSEKEIGDE